MSYEDSLYPKITPRYINEIRPVEFRGGSVYGFRSLELPSLDGLKKLVQVLNLEPLGKLDFDTGKYRLDPLRTNGLKSGTRSGMDSLQGTD